MSALRLLFALPAALAMRAVDMEMELLSSEAAAEGRFSLTGKPGQICGGVGIWKELTKGADAEGELHTAHNINWPRIQAYKEEHMQRQEQAVAAAEERLRRLQAELEAALAQEAVPRTGDTEHVALVEAAVGPGGYEDIATAAKWQCGGQKKKIDGVRRPKAMRGAFENSLPIFEKAARDFFEQKTHRLDGMGFLDTCKRLLVTDNAEDPHHWCAQLCQEYKDRAQSASFGAQGEAAGVSSKIKEEIEALMQEMAAAKASMANCDVDWQGLEDFRDSLQGLKTTQNLRHEALRKAEGSFQELEFSQGDVEEQIEEAEDALTAAVARLGQAGERTRKARKALQKAKATSKGTKEKMNELDEELTGLRDRLVRAKSAHDLVGKLKEKVAHTMMLMMQLADAALREPLSNLGFSEDPTDLEADFVPAETTEAAPVLKEAVGQLKDYCTETALPAFALVREKIQLDLDPLCGMQGTEAIFADLVAQVDQRKEIIKADMLTVVSWLNPWRAHQDKTMMEAEAMEDKLVSQGQLAFLEQVKGIFTEPANAWFKYLIGWRKDGPHHKRFSKFEKAIKELEKKEKEFDKALKEVKDAAAKGKEDQEAAEKELEEAIANEEADEKEKDEIKETLANLKEEWEKTNAALGEWEDQVAKAKAALEAANEALRAAYAEGVAEAEE